jgi:glucose/arabinose dehydrogenase
MSPSSPSRLRAVDRVVPRHRHRPGGILAVAASVLVLASAIAACDVGGTGTGTGRSATPAGASSTGGSPAASGGVATRSAPPGGSSSGAARTSAPFDPAAVTVTLETVVDGLEAPLAVVNAGDSSGRLFIGQQGGQIRIVRDGRLIAEPFLDIADRITSGGERGLLGVAFHPDFPADPRLFVDYTDDQGDTRVSSFRVDAASPDRVDPSTEQRLLFVDQPFANHNGGALAFGPDGFLVVALGDGGGGGDPQGNGQNPRSLLGKILRIDVNGTTPDRAYGIPTDNPFASGQDGNAPEVWLTGLRNPWRLSFDRATGDLWIGDVGQNQWEEIDVQRAGAIGGTNFGWNRAEGNHCFRGACDAAALTAPITEYGHEDGCTVIGGHVYRGSAQTALSGGYVFGDYCTGRLWAIDPAGDAFLAPTVVGEMGGGLSAFGEDEAGELYATDIRGGRLLRVVGTER